jgi:hypothetical protein
MCTSFEECFRTGRFALANGIVKGSEAWAALEGVTDANVGRHVDEVREIVHPDDRWLLADGSDRAFATGEPYSVEFRIVPEPGTIRWRRSTFTISSTIWSCSTYKCRKWTAWRRPGGSTRSLPSEDGRA